MNVRHRRRTRRGFTLMEVLLVLAILVILSSLAVVGYQQIRKNMMQQAAKVQIGLYTQASDIYHNDVGVFPLQLADLVVPPQDVEENKWKGPYLKGDLQKDPWGVDYEYTVVQDNFGNDQVQIRSSGPNRIAGDNDDISNI